MSDKKKRIQKRVELLRSFDKGDYSTNAYKSLAIFTDAKLIEVEYEQFKVVSIKLTDTGRTFLDFYEKELKRIN